jgi:hypothetical protein
VTSTRLTYRAVHGARGYVLAGRIESAREDFSRMACELHDWRLQRAASRPLGRLSAHCNFSILTLEFCEALHTDRMSAPFFAEPFTTATALVPRFASDFARLTSWLEPNVSFAGRFGPDMGIVVGGVIS